MKDFFRDEPEIKGKCKNNALRIPVIDRIVVWKVNDNERIEMSWIEIIRVHPVGRGAVIKILELCNKVRLPKIAGRSVKLNVYGNTGFNKDLSIHIHWTCESGAETRTPFGIELSHALLAFGQVSHTVWIEQSESLLDKASNS
ncbi:MAG: hypothetical protein AB9866_10090 [Syntrophobacteraceae bacterium]